MTIKTRGAVCVFIVIFLFLERGHSIEEVNNIKVKQSLNQNAVISVDKKKDEFLLIGKGVGFSKKKGDFIKINNSIKIYPMSYSEQEQKILELIDEIPSEIILMIEETIKKAEKILEKELNYTLIFTLSSHVYYALQREESIDTVTLPFDYGLNYIFPSEYEAAKYSVEYLRDEYNLELTDAEIIFFTFHFVNALQGSNTDNSAIDTANILNDIIEVLEKETPIYIDKDSLHFSRFLIHIRYFLIRQYEGKTGKNEEFEQLSNYVSAKFIDAAKIVRKIKIILKNKYGLNYSYEENLYLILHTQRLIEEDRKDDN